MVKTPKTRHSRPQREPVTIDLEPEAVTRAEGAEPSIFGTSTSAADSERDAAIVESAEPAPQSNAQPGPTDVRHSSTPGQEASGAGGTIPDPEKPAFETKEPAASSAFGSEASSSGFGRESAKPSVKPSPDARAATKPAERPVPPAPPPSRPGRAPVFAAGIVGAVIALAAGAALQAAGILPSASRGGGDGDSAAIAALQAEVEALKSAPPAAPDAGLGAEIDALKAQVAGLAQGSGGGDAEALQGLQQRLDGLEASVAQVGREAGGDPAAMAALGEKVTGLESQASAAGETAAAAEQKLAAVEQTLAGLTAKVDAQAAQPKIALAISTAALKSAVERGVPFTAELETFAAIAPNAPEIAALRGLAEAGVPTRSAIESEVDAAAAAMIGADRPVDPDAGYLDRLLSSAEALVTVRPIGAVEGTGVPEIAARIEVAVKAGDYAAALAEYETLPEAPKAAGAAFAQKLRARLDADRLVDQSIAGAMQAG